MVEKEVTEKATTVEEKQLRDYEMVVIISPEVADEKLSVTIDSITQFITGNGGVVSEVQPWGKRKLAYPVKHFTEGSYVLTRFKLKPASSKQLEAKLRISDEVLRHLLIRLDN